VLFMYERLEERGHADKRRMAPWHTAVDRRLGKLWRRGKLGFCVAGMWRAGFYNSCQWRKGGLQNRQGSLLKLFVSLNYIIKIQDV
jgi:hypothetical protein